MSAPGKRKTPRELAPGPVVYVCPACQAHRQTAHRITGAMFCTECDFARGLRVEMVAKGK